MVTGQGKIGSIEKLNGIGEPDMFFSVESPT
jgi:hypothetical protein